MSALEALKLIAPTAHLERRGGVEGGAEGGGAAREAALRSKTSLPTRRSSIEQTKDLAVSRSAHSVKFHIVHLPRGAPTWLNSFARSGITTRSRPKINQAGDQFCLSGPVQPCSRAPSALARHRNAHTHPKRLAPHAAHTPQAIAALSLIL